MNNSKKYGAIFLKVLLTFSLIFPYCCHAQKYEHTSHQDKVTVASSQNQHHAGECSCGHELAQDFQKAKKVYNAPSLSQLSIGTFNSSFSLSKRISFLSVFKKNGFKDLQKPSLHLLNSVFLN